MRILTVLLFGSIVAGSLFFVLQTKTGNGLNRLSLPSDQSFSPTPFPFEEITVPYLRARSYESSLGKLGVSYETSSYTAYLTSYTSDGLSVNGLLTRPRGTEPEGGWPAVLFIHGYIPPSQYRTESNYYDYVDYLAQNGFVVFKIDLRGHGKSEGEAGGAYYSADYVIDALNAREALRNASFVNPEKVGLWGHSMAGNVVLRSLAVKPEIPAAVIWAGAVYSYEDMAKYGISDASYQPMTQTTQRAGRRSRLRETYGEPSSDNPFWKLVAPTNYLDDLKGAIQLHHAVDDPVVSIRYSRDLIDLLKSTPVPYELQEYADGGHNISGARFTEAMQKTVTFFKKYL